jgi:hypothetical protein
VLRINRSGANVAASHTANGLSSFVGNTGTTSTNYGGYFSAANATTNVGVYASGGGGTNNYAAIFNGNVGINQVSPVHALDVFGSMDVSSTLTATKIKPTGNPGIDFGNGGGANSILFYNGGGTTTRTGIAYLTGGATNAGLLFHTYGGIGSPILFSSGFDQTTATIANSNMAIFDGGSVSIGGAADVANVKFQITTTTKGSIPAPLMTSTQRNAIASPTNGLQVYDITISKMCFYSSAIPGWRQLTDTAAP